jgi:hypothetical protein
MRTQRVRFSILLLEIQNYYLLLFQRKCKLVYYVSYNQVRKFKFSVLKNKFQC